MSRREFITLVGGTAVWPLVAQAQQPERMRRIGVLLAANADDVDLSFGVGWSDLPRATAEGIVPAPQPPTEDSPYKTTF